MYACEGGERGEEPRIDNIYDSACGRGEARDRRYTIVCVGEERSQG